MLQLVFHTLEELGQSIFLGEAGDALQLGQLLLTKLRRLCLQPLDPLLLFLQSLVAPLQPFQLSLQVVFLLR